MNFGVQVGPPELLHGNARMAASRQHARIFSHIFIFPPFVVGGAGFMQEWVMHKKIQYDTKHVFKVQLTQVQGRTHIQNALLMAGALKQRVNFSKHVLSKIKLS